MKCWEFQDGSGLRLEEDDPGNQSVGKVRQKNESAYKIDVTNTKKSYRKKEKKGPVFLPY